MKKQIAALLTAGALMTSILAGCAGKETASSAGSTASGTTASAANVNATIRVAWWGNQVRNDNTVGALNLFKEANPGVTFETEFSDWSGYWDKMATQAAASSLPDIIQQDYKYYKQYQAKNQLADLTPYVTSKALDLSDCAPSIIDSGKIDGKLYALCIGVNAPAMLYDKEAVAKAGVTIKQNMTVDEFITAAKTINEKTGLKCDTSYGDGENYIEYIVRGQGKVLFEDGKLGIDNASYVVPFFKLFEDGIAGGYFPSAEDLTASVGVGIEQDPLVLGKEWMSLAYSNQLVAFNKAAGKDLGMVTWPVRAGDTQKAMYLKPGQFFSVASTSKNQDICAKVLDFVTNSVDANKKLMAERGVPISSKVAAAIKPLMDTDNQKIFDYVTEVEPSCSTINPPSPEGMGEIIKLIDTLTEQVCYKQMTAQQAADKFFTDANAILKKAAQ